MQAIRGSVLAAQKPSVGFSSLTETSFTVISLGCCPNPTIPSAIIPGVKLLQPFVLARSSEYLKNGTGLDKSTEPICCARAAPNTKKKEITHWIALLILRKPSFST
jgi:hypothetical protein